jgi:FAD/FMN-containing dehydrogenase
MSSKVAHYLQEHLVGEVLDTPQVRRFFSTDGSVFSITPTVAVYPKNPSDIRKVARFTWQLAERGRVIPITARGLGTNLTGGAIGSGIIMVFPAHMNRILELDGKTGSVSIEPGIDIVKLQQTLYTHGRCLPPFPANFEYGTVGGAIANNASGDKSVKYGNIGHYVKELQVVLANGEIIETRRFNKRELSKKMGQSNFEGEIYRSLDTLLEENHETVQLMNKSLTRHSAGYNLGMVKHKDGSFDLTPLIIGSQGTLGIISEAMLSTELHSPSTTMIAAYFDDIRLAEEVITELRKLPDGPSMVEAIDGHLLEFIDQINPNQLKSVISKPFPKLTLLFEFDNFSARIQKRMVKKVEKLLRNSQVNYQVETEEAGQERLWKIRRSTTLLIAHSDGNSQAVPVIEGGVVPLDRISEYMEGLNSVISKYKLASGIWGHAGQGNLQTRPLLDLSQVGDRQKLFKLMDEYYQLVIGLGGSPSGVGSDGRLRGPYLQVLYGEEMYKLLQKTKQIFDPYGTLNPGVKVNIGLSDIKPLLRSEYSVAHIYNHLPLA